MKKALLLASIIFISVSGWSQTRDTLNVTSFQFTNITSKERHAPDSVYFVRSGDTLVILENSWRSYPLKLIAVRTKTKDSLLISVIDTARAGLAADGRFLITVKVRLTSILWGVTYLCKKRDDLGNRFFSSHFSERVVGTFQDYSVFRTGQHCRQNHVL